MDSDDLWDRISVRLGPQSRAGDDLDLEDVIGDPDLAHYQKALGQSARLHRSRFDLPEDWEWTAEVTPSSRAPVPVTAALPAAPEPRRRGGSAELCSTDRRLEPWPAYCWDVCGYYRRLGVHWKASRKELADAYVAAGGENSYPYLRYIMSQLLDRKLRREYDALPLGAVWLKDRYVNDRFKRAAQREAAARGEAAATAEDVLAEWGFGLSKGPATDAEMTALPSRQQIMAAGTPWGQLWAYYVLGRVDISRVGLLDTWQEALITALDGLGIREPFAVGLAANTSSGFVVRHSAVSGSLIIFLAGGTPDRNLARRAAVHIWAEPHS